MKLFECIDGLLVGTKYLAWAIAVVGIFGSLVLFFANLSLGVGSAAVFAASFLLAIGVTLLLLPKKLGKEKMSGKKNIFGGVSLVLAAAVMGIIYLANGGFPELNLLFL
ncbi:MAG: hypothetical protein ACI4HI_09370 [Lachnospiraceae bacterium]